MHAELSSGADVFCGATLMPMHFKASTVASRTVESVAGNVLYVRASIRIFAMGRPPKNHEPQCFSENLVLKKQDVCRILLNYSVHVFNSLRCDSAQGEVEGDTRWKKLPCENDSVDDDASRAGALVRPHLVSVRSFSMMMVSTQRPSRRPCSRYVPTRRKPSFSYKATPAALNGNPDRTIL